MKQVKIVLVLAGMMLAAGFANAQGRFGADSAQCVTYLSYYQEYMKQNNLADAAPQWRKAIQVCPPTASQNMLLDGMKILRKDINAFRNNPIRRKELVDSLMMLHQMRIDNYPKYKVTAQQNMAMDMLNYTGKGEEQKLFSVLSETMDIAGAKTNPSIVVRYMNFANELYQQGVFTDQEVFDAFDKASASIEQIATVKKEEEVANLRRDVENLFMQSGVASCENLVKLFTPRFESNPTDKDVLGNIVAKLTAANCLEEDLYLKSVEALYQVDPSHASAYLLYRLYATRGENEQAVAYLQKAIDNETSDVVTDANYAMEMATFLYTKAARAAKAIEAAKQAAEIDESVAGKAYLLIGTIWGAQKCEGNDIEKRAPYWVAVDYLTKAKRADASLTEEADRMIANFSNYYPKQTDAFMFDLMDGANYTVSCNGLRENTKVRTQK